MALPRTITSANASLIITIPLLYPAPQQIQGFAVDDAWSLEQIDVAEAQMGVDAQLSFGYTPAAKVFGVSLQANSTSVGIFKYWGAATELAKEIYICSAVLSIPGTRESFTMTNGTLTKTTPMTSGKKVLAPLSYQIAFESIRSSILA
jgi:hypothetical protein